MDLWTNVMNYKSGKCVSIQFASQRDLILMDHIHVAHINRTLNSGADYLAKQGCGRPNLIWGY